MKVKHSFDAENQIFSETAFLQAFQYRTENSGRCHHGLQPAVTVACTASHADTCKDFATG
jgi:hypothetical protein